jgi:hypothetical protein
MMGTVIVYCLGASFNLSNISLKLSHIEKDIKELNAKS